MAAFIKTSANTLISLARKLFKGAAVFVLVWLCGFSVFSVAVLTMGPKKPTQTTDVIMVFTGGNGRVETGLSLFAAGKARHLFITGVFPHVSEADILALWSGETALPPCCITIDHEAKSTIQNAAEARAWIETNNYSSIRLVTSDYHMMRALLELHYALPGIDILVYPVRNSELNPGKAFYWQMMFIEYHKTLFRLIRLSLTPQKQLERAKPA